MGFRINLYQANEAMQIKTIVTLIVTTIKMRATVKEEVMDYCARTDIATVNERKQQASIIETE